MVRHATDVRATTACGRVALLLVAEDEDLLALLHQAQLTRAPPPRSPPGRAAAATPVRAVRRFARAPSSSACCASRYAAAARRFASHPRSPAMPSSNSTKRHQEDRQRRDRTPARRRCRAVVPPSRLPVPARSRSWWTIRASVQPAPHSSIRFYRSFEKTQHQSGARDRKAGDLRHTAWMFAPHSLEVCVTRPEVCAIRPRAWHHGASR